MLPLESPGRIPRISSELRVLSVDYGRPGTHDLRSLGTSLSASDSERVIRTSN